MIERIKEHARAGLKLQYWPIIGNELLASILIGGVSGFSARFNQKDMNQLREMVQSNETFRRMIPIILGVLGVAIVIGLVYGFLVGNVIRAGIAKIRLSAYRQNSFSTGELFGGFKQYGRYVGTMALYTVFVSLGTLFFFIPGIIVSLGLFEVPYLLADDPSLSGMEAIRRSWEDMKGHKGELFGLILSFIGWWLLTILTCGILAVFYSGPYMALSEAGFYHELHHNITAETFTEDSVTA